MMNKVYAQDAGINLDDNCLQDGSCTLSIYQTLKIREDSDDNSPATFVSDVFLGATFFIGTIAAIGFIISGLMMSMAGADESMYDRAKKGFIYSIIGLLLVTFSYSMIRLIEYIAQGQTG